MFYFCGEMPLCCLHQSGQQMTTLYSTTHHSLLIEYIAKLYSQPIKCAPFQIVPFLKFQPGQPIIGRIAQNIIPGLFLFTDSISHRIALYSTVRTAGSTVRYALLQYGGCTSNSTCAPEHLEIRLEIRRLGSTVNDTHRALIALCNRPIFRLQPLSTPRCPTPFDTFHTLRTVLCMSSVHVYNYCWLPLAQACLPLPLGPIICSIILESHHQAFLPAASTTDAIQRHPCQVGAAYSPGVSTNPCPAWLSGLSAVKHTLDSHHSTTAIHIRRSRSVTELDLYYRVLRTKLS